MAEKLTLGLGSPSIAMETCVSPVTTLPDDYNSTTTTNQYYYY